MRNAGRCQAERNDEAHAVQSLTSDPPAFSSLQLPTQVMPFFEM